MNKLKRKNFLYFVVSFFLCFATCSATFIPLIIPQKQETKPADTNYSYATYENLSVDIILVLTDAPLDFYIKLNTSASMCRVTAFAKKSVKNSTQFLSASASPKEKAKFFDKSIDRSIILNTEALTNLTDFLGGIVCDTPYGLPSPAKEKTAIALNETLLMYGSSAMAIIKSEPFPDSERAKYSAKIIALIVQKFLKAADMEAYLLLENSGETDISYSDYYDNRSLLSVAGKYIEHSSYGGLWIKENFYLH